MQLTEKGLAEQIAAMRDGLKQMRLRHREALRRMAEAEIEAHQLGAIVGATAASIEVLEAQLADRQPQGEGSTA